MNQSGAAGRGVVEVFSDLRGNPLLQYSILRIDPPGADRVAGLCLSRAFPRLNEPMLSRVTIAISLWRISDRDNRTILPKLSA